MNFEYFLKELTDLDLDEDFKGFLLTLSNLSEIKEITLSKMKEILSKINSENGIIYIVKTKEKKIIGTAKLLVEQKFTHSAGKVGHIEDVAVLKGYEGKGIASEIIKQLIFLAKQKGCYKLILDCKDNLIPFYNKFGFYKNENCMRCDLAL